MQQFLHILQYSMFLTNDRKENRNISGEDLADSTKPIKVHISSMETNVIST